MLPIACRPLPAMLCCILVAGLIGCGDKNVTELVSQVKQSATETVSNVKESATQVTENVTQSVQENVTKVTETVAANGKMNLKVNTDISVGACYTFFVPPNGGRPAVLQLKSFKDTEQETFPSVFCQAQVKADTVAALVGQTVSAQLFVKPSADAPTWYSTTSAPVELQIASITEGKMQANVVSGSLRNAGDDSTAPVTGSMEAVVLQ